MQLFKDILLVIMIILTMPVWVPVSIIAAIAGNKDGIALWAEIGDLLGCTWKDTWFDIKERRARKLLYRNLPKCSLHMGNATVYGGVTGNKYVIKPSSVVMNDVAEFCVVFQRDKYKFPRSDYVLAMALHIQHNEPTFLRIAHPIVIYSNRRLEEIRNIIGYSVNGWR